MHPSNVPLDENAQIGLVSSGFWRRFELMMMMMMIMILYIYAEFLVVKRASEYSYPPITARPSKMMLGTRSVSFTLVLFQGIC